MISASEMLNHTSNNTQCENHIPNRVEQMLNKLNSNYNTQQNHQMLGSTQNNGMLGNSQNHQMFGSTQNHSLLGNSQNKGMLGSLQNKGILGSLQNSGMSGDKQNSEMLGGLQNSGMLGGKQNNGILGAEQNDRMLGGVGERINTNIKEEKMDEITKLLNDFIKNNNLSLEEQTEFRNELKKINNILPPNKKIVISFEKNKFNIQILDSGAEQKLKVGLLKNEQDQENIPEVTTYDFDTNLWYISLSSIVLTFLIIVMLVIKWKDIN